MKSRKKAWGGRFSGETDKFVEEFTASIEFDKRLYRQDIKGSMAHCALLADAGIVTGEEAQKITTALKEIEEEISGGGFQFSISDEDIHMNVERRLIEKIGQTGRKLHTGRSRNDQVVLDLRLYLIDEIDDILAGLDLLKKNLVAAAKKNIDIVIPGYTHLQIAQPVLFSHYLLAYYEMLDRDAARLVDCRKRVDVMPLGSGALAGSNYLLDREIAAEFLGFGDVSRNSMDAVSDRDFVIEFMSAAAMLIMHLSRFSEDLVIWSSREFRLVVLPDQYCTGSSIMPQKKNPDVPELVRGKSGRVYGNLISVLTMMKGVPLAYNKDMQEDKEPLFDTIDTIKGAVRSYQDIVANLEINKTRAKEMLSEGYINATEVADYLVGKGLPFRTCHDITGRIVKYAIDRGVQIDELSLDELKGFSGLVAADIFEFISIENALKRKDQIGSTSKRRVLERISSIE